MMGQLHYILLLWKVNQDAEYKMMKNLSLEGMKLLCSGNEKMIALLMKNGANIIVNQPEHR